MYLTRHRAPDGPRWAADGVYLAPGLTLAALLALPPEGLRATATGARTGEPARDPLLAPLEAHHEVWACGVTYRRSRDARIAESDTGDVYDKVYHADRVEVFFKAPGWRVRGPHDPIRVRADSSWNVPEPELTLVLNRAGAILGYTVGNDVSSRDIEGENPLYLPQAKVYDGACALGPGVVVAEADELRSLRVGLAIERAGQVAFQGETDTGQLKRSLEEMARWLFAELAFPAGAFLMTGTGLVPPDEFSLRTGDQVRITVGNLVLENPVAG